MRLATFVTRVHALVVNVSNHMLHFFALLGGSMVKTRNAFFYVALLVAGVLFPPFGVFVACCLLSWAYRGAA